MITLACGKATPCFVFPDDGGIIGVVPLVLELEGINRASLALIGFVVSGVAVQEVMAYDEEPCKIACRSATVRVSPGLRWAGMKSDGRAVALGENCTGGDDDVFVAVVAFGVAVVALLLLLLLGGGIMEKELVQADEYSGNCQRVNEGSKIPF